MASEIRDNNIKALTGLGTVTISSDGINVGAGIITANNFTGSLTGTASTATASATAYGISGTPTLSGITSVSTSNLTVNGNAYPSAGPLSNRNLIINGAMQVAQRGTSQSLAHDGNTGLWTLDRFAVNMSGADQWDCTVTQSSEAPDGYANSLLITTGTAENAIAAAEYFSVQHKIEAQNLQHIDSGTSSAKALTLSFWVRSSQTGTFAFSIYKGDQTARGISATYTISSVNTWEYKTIAIPGDTGGGGIDNDNGNGWNLYWILAAGSDWTSTDSTSWINYVTTGLAYGHTQNGVITTASATWQITGVQLEVGSVATPFEHRSYGDELARCQRYYYRHADGSQNSNAGLGSGLWYQTTDVYISIHFPTTMRANPTLKFNRPTTTCFRAFRGGTSSLTDDLATQEAAPNCAIIQLYNLSAAGTQGQATWCQVADASAYVAFESEL